MFVRAEKQDVGQCSLDSVANAARTVGAGASGILSLICLLQLPQMGRADRQFAREGPPERTVGGHQCLQAFVDLPVHPLLALLQRQHHQDPDPDPDQGHQRNAKDGGQDPLPSAEVEKAHVLPPLAARTCVDQMPPGDQCYQAKAWS